MGGILVRLSILIIAVFWLAFFFLWNAAARAETLQPCPDRDPRGRCLTTATQAYRDCRPVSPPGPAPNMCSVAPFPCEVRGEAFGPVIPYPGSVRRVVWQRTANPDGSTARLSLVCGPLLPIPHPVRINAINTPRTIIVPRPPRQLIPPESWETAYATR